MLIDVVQTPNYSDLTINIKYGQSKYFLYQTPYPPKIEKEQSKIFTYIYIYINLTVHKIGKKKLKKRENGAEIVLIFLIN